MTGLAALLIPVDGDPEVLVDSDWSATAVKAALGGPVACSDPLFQSKRSLTLLLSSERGEVNPYAPALVPLEVRCGPLLVLAMAGHPLRPVGLTKPDLILLGVHLLLDETRAALLSKQSPRRVEPAGAQTPLPTKGEEPL